MKILFVLDSLGTGGAERSTCNYWYFLRDSGHDVNIIALRKRSEGIQQEVIEAGFNVTFLTGQSFLSQIQSILRAVKEIKPQIVHSILFKSNLRTRFVRMINSNFVHLESLVNTVYSSFRKQDPNVNRFKLNVYKWIDKYTTKIGTDYYHSVVDAVKLHYVQELGLAEELIKTVRRGRKPNPYILDESKQRDILTELGINDSTFVIMNVGRQEYQKGQVDLIRAFADLTSSIPDFNAILIIIGRTGNMSGQINQMIKDLRIKDQVRILGHVNDVYPYLAIADLFIMPSLFEGIGGTVIEAQASGLPVISTDLAGVREISSPAVLFIPPNSKEDCSTMIERMFASKKDRISQGRQNLEYFHNHLTEDQSHHGLINYYKEIVAEL